MHHFRGVDDGVRILEFDEVAVTGEGGAKQEGIDVLNMKWTFGIEGPDSSGKRHLYCFIFRDLLIQDSRPAHRPSPDSSLSSVLCVLLWDSGTKFS